MMKERNNCGGVIYKDKVSKSYYSPCHEINGPHSAGIEELNISVDYTKSTRFWKDFVYIRGKKCSKWDMEGLSVWETLRNIINRKYR